MFCLKLMPVRPLVFLFAVFIFALAVPDVASANDQEESPYMKWSGALIGGDPHQSDIPSTMEEGRIKHYRVVPQKYFSAKALVLSTKHYARMAGDHTTALAPVDLALGWGPMSDPDVLEHMYIGQKGRWYHFYRSGDAPISKDAVYRHSGNMHMIPQNEDVKNTLASIRRGDIVHVRGYLVDVFAPGGWRWISSESRTDRGDASCEIVYVAEVKILKRGIEWEQHHRKPSALR
jgi:hypothetical protein